MDSMSFGPFRLDPRTESVWRDGEEIRLRPKTFAVLRYLTERPNSVVTKEALLDAVWPGVVVGDAALAVCIGEIRKALDDNAQSPRFIETIHRRGYRFIGARGSPPAATTVPEGLWTNLPHPRTSFIGRTHEIEQVKRSLTGSALVTLMGAGGVGKTRLAIEVATSVARDFRHGAWLVDLAPLTDPQHLPDAVATALSVRATPRRSAIERLVEWLRLKTILVVVDNCEHLRSPVAALVETLLRDCPSLRILATSRDRLGLTGEVLHLIPPLAVPAPGAALSFNEIMAFEAVRLFVERAADVHWGGAVSERDLGPIVEICRRLDGIPLAIELAAARVLAMTVDEIAARLDDRFQLLIGSNRTVLSRHQTLRGVLDWSHQLLSDPERVLFRRLSVFAGGSTLDAAERVGGGAGIAAAEVISLLTQLVDHSLVVFEGAEGRGRYRLLETTSQYARERLIEAGEVDVMRDRHLAYLIRLAEESESGLRGPRQGEWLGRLDAETDNIRTALEWALSCPERVDAGAHLGSAMCLYWFMRDRMTEHQHWFEAALASRAKITPGVRAKALLGLGMIAWRLDDYERGLAVLEESLKLSRELGAGELSAHALHFRAHIEEAQGQLDQAVRTHEETLATFRKIGGFDLAKALHCLATTLRKRGDVARAKPLLEETVTLGKAVGGAWGLSYPLLGLGLIAVAEGDRARARALFEQSLVVAHEGGDRSGAAYAQLHLGNMARHDGDYATAASFYRASLATWNDGGDRRNSATYLEALSQLALAQGCAERAAQLLGAVDQLLKTTGGAFAPADGAAHERCLTAARDRLGREAFETAWRRGQTMTVAQAIDYAMTDERR
jgi:predicted ATPase